MLKIIVITDDRRAHTCLTVFIFDHTQGNSGRPFSGWIAGAAIHSSLKRLHLISTLRQHNNFQWTYTSPKTD